jgi:hypothetical protein
MDSTAQQLLTECQLSQRLHPALLTELTKRNFIPSWTDRFDEEREDWLRELHHSVTQEGWNVLDTVSAGLVSKGQFLGMAAAAKAIAIPISSPGYLHTLLDLLAKPMVHPDSTNPQEKMLWDPSLAHQAGEEFRLMLGMLKETNYFDVPQMASAWSPAVTAGVRFIYYHELGHIVHAQVQANKLPSWLSPAEAQDEILSAEMVADQFGLSMLLLELRNHQDLLIPGMVGIVLALGLTTMKAFAGSEGAARMHGVKRMNRLFDWAQKAKMLGSCTDEALLVSTHLWKSLFYYFQQMGEVRLPSPIYSLLRQTSQRPTSDWSTASGYVLQWCAFGDRRRVLNTLRMIWDEARSLPNDERARGVLEVINFLIDDLHTVDRVLGLREALQ